MREKYEKKCEKKISEQEENERKTIFLFLGGQDKNNCGELEERIKTCA